MSATRPKVPLAELSNRRKRYGGRFVIRLAILFAIGGWLFAHYWRSGPEVDGLTLDEWLETACQYENGSYRSYRSMEFDRAMQKFGTNAIPQLLSLMRTRDVPAAAHIARVLGLGMRPNDPWIFRLGLNRGMIAQIRAANGFAALGPLATNAIPELLRIPPGFATQLTFQEIGTAGLPHLEAATRGTNLQTVSWAMSLLEVSAFDYRREETVSSWVRCLSHESPSIRVHAARLIGNAPPIRAQEAIAALESAAKDSDPEVAAAAQTALTRIKRAM